jgi:hypothetical protein
MEFIGPKIQVPANASRLFKNYNEALRQPVADIQLATSTDNRFIFNSLFSSARIAYDLNYCTVEPFHFSQSKQYFDKIQSYSKGFDSFIEIGCGQGEFVEFLRAKGLKAYGFDPVLRKHSDYLFAGLWSFKSEQEMINQVSGSRTMYVMRCVLPHIPDPFKFLDGIFESQPHSAVLLEFQRREWIEKEKVWTQISHDHVNIFSAEDFSPKYRVIAQENFSNDEWVYVLLAKNYEDAESSSIVLPEKSTFEEIFFVRESEISLLANDKRPIAIYGAAGKGIVLAYSLSQAGVTDLVAIDSDPNRHNLFMETSGVQILDMKVLKTRLNRDFLILVANPNHYSYVSMYFEEENIACIGRLGQSPL